MTALPGPGATRATAARWGSLRGPVLVAAAAATSAALLHLRDPHDDGSYGYCPFLVLTGLPCPGCGGLRAVNDLTRGDVVAAVSSNLLAVVLVVGVAAAWCVWVVRRLRGRTDALLAVTWRQGLVVLAVVVVFGVVRNTPWGSWLAP